MDYGYSTTSYGAQGGAGGGGFLASGSQGDSGGAGKGYSKDNLRPVTIKQLMDAQLPHPDADAFKLDGADLTQVTFVGQIRNVSQQPTNYTYKLDDGTGTIEVKRWVDIEENERPDDPAKPKLVENVYARVWGRLKSFSSKLIVTANVIRPITDYNEIQYHLLEATAVHLYFTRGSLGQPGADGANGVNGQQQQQNGAGGGTGGHLPAGLSASARRVYQCLNTSPQSNEGLHMNEICVKLNMDSADVQKAGDELINHGLLYTTVDDWTWAILDQM